MPRYMAMLWCVVMPNVPDGAEHAKFYTPDRPIKVEALYDAG